MPRTARYGLGRLAGVVPATMLAAALFVAPQVALAEEQTDALQDDQQAVAAAVVEDATATQEVSEPANVVSQPADGTAADQGNATPVATDEAAPAEQPEAVDTPAADASADEEAAIVEDPAATDAEQDAPAEGDNATQAQEQEPANAEATDEPADSTDELAAAESDDFNGKTFVIQSAKNGSMVLDATNGKTANGTNIRIWTYNNSAAQKWQVVRDDASGYYYIAVYGTNGGQVLDLDTSDGTKGANLRLLKKTAGRDGQLWTFVENGGKYALISKLNAAMGLDLEGGKTTKGTNVRLWTSNGTDAQLFRLYDCNPVVAGGKTVENGLYVVTSTLSSSAAVDVKGNAKTKGANVEIDAKSSGTDTQRLYFEYDGKGYYVVTVVGSGKVLDVDGGKVLPGANIRQWTRNNTDAQKWAVRQNSDGTITMVNKGTGLFFDLAGAKTASGTNIRGWSQTHGTGQKFKLTDAEFLSEGIYAINSYANQSVVFDVKSGSTGTAALQLWTSNGSLAQRYQVVRVGKDLYRIRTAASGGWITDNGAGAAVQTGSSKTAVSDSNTWQAIWNGTYFSLKNVATGKMIGGTSAKTAKGTILATQAPSTKNGAQYFIFSGARLIANGMYVIHNAAAVSKSVAVAGSSTANGANIAYAASANNASQKFYIEAYGNGYRIRSVLSGKVISPSSAGASNVVQVTPGSSNLQVWIPSIADGGAVVFKNAQTGKVLDLQGGAKGTNVQQWKANGTAAQNWKIASTRMYGWLRVNGTWQFHYGGGTVKNFSNATHTAWERINNTSSRTKYLVSINNSTCRTYVFQGKKGAWEPVYEWLCCVGTNHPTDPSYGETARGTWYIKKKGYRMGWYPYEYYWCEFWDRSVDEHGEGQRIHSVLKKGGPNSADYDGRLGLKITHGCVRLATANAKWIYDRCPIGTAVISY